MGACIGPRDVRCAGGSPQGVGRCNYSDCRVSRAVFDSSYRVLSAIPIVIVIPAVYSAITRVAIGEYTL